ncbi:MAG: ribbon-helix-helix protein, CopG family [Gammaproteobacteria bacterium]
MAGFSLRLPDDLETRLNREAREEGLPRSEIARAAIEEFLQRRERVRCLAAFVKEARAAYGDADIRREALEIAVEALPLDNEALEYAERTPRAAICRTRPRKARR